MKLAISNIALTPFQHSNELAQIAELGLEGLEVAPSRIWPDTWRGLRSRDISKYRKLVESHGLSIVGIHSLFFDHPDLGLFKDTAIRKETLSFMVHLSEVCRDLGGATLIYGGGRKRGNLPLEEAYDEACAFFGDLCKRIEGHGTIYCFEPLGPNDSDFINTVADSIRIVEAVDSPSLKAQLDAKALVENGDVKISAFKAAKPHLVHYHANEPGLGVLGSSGMVDHKVLGKMLKEISYDGYVSIEQRMISKTNPIQSISESVNILKDCYT
jgi:sugar phosphate isomerase/epimerase